MIFIKYIIVLTFNIFSFAKCSLRDTNDNSNSDDYYDPWLFDLEEFNNDINPLNDKLSLLIDENILEKSELFTYPKYNNKCNCVTKNNCLDDEENIERMNKNAIAINKTCEDNKICCEFEINGCGEKYPENKAYTNISEFGKWPWQVAILYTLDKISYEFLCGGVIVNSRSILTAAHCISSYNNKDEISNLIVRLGEWNRTLTLFPTYAKNKSLNTHIDYNIIQIRIHPSFDSKYFYNDIALLIVDHKIKWTTNIFPLCLIGSFTKFNHSTCVVTGWGRSHNDLFGDNLSSIIKEMEVILISSNECETLLRRTMLGLRFKLHNGFICAKSKKEEEGPCWGDEGGPLACQMDDGRYALIGLTSWIFKCGRKNIPSVYVNIDKYRPWILKIFRGQKKKDRIIRCIQDGE